MQKKRKYDMVALRMLLDRIAEKEEQIGREWVKKVSLSKLTRKDFTDNGIETFFLPKDMLKLYHDRQKMNYSIYQFIQ